jgi:hypothetical protein
LAPFTPVKSHWLQLLRGLFWQLDYTAAFVIYIFLCFSLRHFILNEAFLSRFVHNFDHPIFYDCGGRININFPTRPLCYHKYRNSRALDKDGEVCKKSNQQNFYLAAGVLLITVERDRVILIEIQREEARQVLSIASRVLSM